MTTRRSFVRTAGALGAAAITGCIHSGGSEEDDGDAPGPGGGNQTQEGSDSGGGAQGTGNWPMYSADARNTGNANLIGPSEAAVDTVDVGFAVNSSPAVVDDVVYVGDTDGALHAFTGGERLWEFDTGERIRSSAAVGDGRVFIGSDSGSVYAVEADTGDLDWQFETGGRVRSQPTVIDGQVYVGSHDGMLYRLSTEWGEEIWRYEAGNEIWSKPAVAHDSVYVSTRGGNLHRVWRENGERVRTTNQGLESRSSPAVEGEEGDHGVYYGLEDGSLYALRFYIDAGVQSREERWSVQTDGAVRTSPALLEDRLVFGNDAGMVHCLDKSSGEEIWSFEAGDGEVRSSPAVDGERVYFGGGDDAIYAVSLDDGEQVWRAETEGSVYGGVAVAGSLYVASVDSNLYTVG